MVDYINDKAFEAVLQNTGQNIEAFVDDFFSFLARRSDFFVESPPEGGKIGFPPGVAAKLVISKFKKWEEYSRLKSHSTSSPPQAKVVKPEDIPVGHEEICTTDVKQPSPVLKPPEPVKPSKEPPPNKPVTNSPSTSLSDSYNGRKTDKYSWSQSIKDIDVYLSVDKSIKTKRQIKVDIQMNKIRVDTTDASNQVTTTDWILPHSIVKDESYWSLYPGESIFISLQKAREMWWDHMFEGEEPIDRTKIDASRPMEDLPDQDQAKLQELIWNQTQKLQGGKTSDEMKMEEIMKKAWDAEGSPFKGQPFDMSKIKLANNSVQLD